MVERTPWGNGIGIAGKKILFGVTGGIAAYKAAYYCRGLKGFGAEVSPVLTENARRFVTELTFSALSGVHASTGADAFDPGDPFYHIDLPRWADLFVICPATANFIGKAAAGIADDLLSTMLLAYRGGAIFFPTMNGAMYENPAVKRNIETLTSLGHTVVEPESGPMACGEEGRGRLVSFDAFIHAIQSALLPKPLKQKKVLITAGPTREPIDPVRYISNRSSGKMGFELAWAAKSLGASVVLVSGPTCLSPPKVDKFVSVETSEEMLNAVKMNKDRMDCIIMAAAVADFTPRERLDKKLKKDAVGDNGLTLSLQETTDILDYILKNRSTKQCIVGFSAETGDLVKNALKKMEKKPVDIMVANNVTEPGAGFDVDTNKITLIMGKTKQIEELPIMHKADVALRILHKVAEVLN